MNNDGTVSYYEQGVNRLSNGELYEGSWIDRLLNGKVNFKLKNRNKKILEMLNGDKHGPVIVYDFNGKVKIDYCSNGEKIFLL